MDIRSALAGQLYGDVKPVSRAEPSLRGSKLDFGQAFQDSALETLRGMRAGEATVTAGLTGKADPQSVVQALAATELAVETAVTVRDKVVEAYNEILRMPV
jgi:flagellar hook-basal body complex protein FliE